MSRRGRATGPMLAAALLVTAAGCVAPTAVSTSVFADVTGERVILVLNLVRVIEQDERFAIYLSDPRSLDRWTLLGTYGGRASAVVAREGVLWVFFDGGERGKHFARTYRFAGRAPDSDGASPAELKALTSDAAPARVAVTDRVEGLPFPWAPQTACRGSGGALWVAGIDGGRAVAARLASVDDEGRAVWDVSVPPGPPIDELAGTKVAAPAAGDPDGERTLPLARVRVSASADLYAFWSVTPAGAGAAARVGGARFVTGAAEWRALPDYAVAHEDFCVAPSAGGAVGLVLTKYAQRSADRLGARPHRVELAPDGEAWGPPDDVSAARQRFLFGYVPRAAWVVRDGGELLVRTNTQRVEIIKHLGGAWEALVPAGPVALYLTEISVLLVGAGAALLVIVGVAVLTIRLRRLRGRGRGRAPGAQPGSGRADLAPVGARAVAALLDVIVVSGAVLSLAGLPDAPANPLVPDPRPLVLHLGALAALACYGAVMEAHFGGTLGKLALGLRVELAAGGRPGVREAIIRNVLRPVDLIPPYLGAVGLGMMTVSARRQRLGDLAAGTVVVSVRRARRAAETKGQSLE